MTESTADVCDVCGYTTSRHLIHDIDGCCYCTRHYLLHILNDEVKKEKLEAEEQKYHK